MTVFKVGTTIKNFITGINSNFSELSKKLTYNPISYKTLYSGSVAVPSNSSGNSANITLTDSVTKFDGVIIQREGCSCWQSIQNMAAGTVFKVVNAESDFNLMEGCNLYMCNVKIKTATQLQLSNNVYSGLRTTGAGRYITNFEDKPITKIIGIKFN